MHTYDIAISFAGEDREIAEKLANSIVLKGFNVFYDDYEKANLWGKNLYDHLIKIYRDEAKYCLILISNNYAKKLWTNHERRAAQTRAIKENCEYILPLKLDDTDIDGILDTVGYIEYNHTKFEEIINLIEEKIQKFNEDHGIDYSIIELATVLKDAFPEFTAADATTKCPTCETYQSLTETKLQLDNGDTLYICKNGCQPIIVISRPEIVAWPGRGYRIGNFVIRNASDILIQTNEMKNPFKILARKAALMKAKPNDK
ncbi:MAG: hypothetical protein COA85_00235 [Robiginitomaculum sp.]|nr:MAG: hypothetical protein COA85_00235 [Robiginitomaculum sp.]